MSDDLRLLLELQNKLEIELKIVSLSSVLRISPSATYDLNGNIIGLNLSGLGLTYFPEAILEFNRLINLNLSLNKIETIPKKIAKLQWLREIDLSQNKIQILPKEVLNLDVESVIYYNVSQNEIDEDNYVYSDAYDENEFEGEDEYEFGDEFEDDQQTIGGEVIGGYIRLNENPFKSPPIEILIHGKNAIKSYFEEIENDETTQLFEAKLLLVGQGDVGKTHLLNRLIFDNVKPDTISTEGIDIHQWNINSKKTDDFRVNFWDFGGQEIYHATHQFFLTKRSLYLFVWEARTDADLLSFDYWLNTVKILSDNSPIIVIQNKIDERKKSINQEGWKNQFPNIVDYHDISALKGINTDALKDVIISELEKLPHIGDLLPQKWVSIRRRLESIEKNFIPFAQYLDICYEYKMDRRRAIRLSDYYHDLGVFLHFKNNPVLKSTIYLNPEWATDAVYKVIDNNVVKDNFGKFHFNELENIWKDQEEFPPEKYTELLELMKSFELCFELSSGQEYIIPELLRANQPNFEWDNKENLRFRYTYNFMPSGIITRLIVATHDLIKSDLYWKDGMVLKWENSEAQIIKTHNREVEIRINGSDKKTLLGIIRRHMDGIHSPFSNLEVKEMIPCICSECLDSEKYHFYSYQDLLKAKSKKRRSLDCLKSFEQISIQKLLGGIENQPLEQRGNNIKKIKIFLASSSELSKEREALKHFCYDETKKNIHKNIFFDLVIWEDLKHSFAGDRIQDYLNQKLLECDIVICLFYKKLGNFTKEEFDIAYDHFKAGQKPKYIYAFFKSGQVEIDDIDKEILKIKELQESIEKSEQIYKKFDSIDSLILQTKEQIEFILPELLEN